jgi:hypothetical protein
MRRIKESQRRKWEKGEFQENEAAGHKTCLHSMKLTGEIAWGSAMQATSRQKSEFECMAPGANEGHAASDKQTNMGVTPGG